MNGFGRQTIRHVPHATLAAALVVTSACSGTSDGGGSATTGGSKSSGGTASSGAPSQGGALANTGGTTQPTTGGSKSSGGAPSTGGVSATGGSLGAGGSTAAGGKSSMSGGSGGGSNSGGKAGTGGKNSMGGKSSTGGKAGTGGSGGTVSTGGSGGGSPGTGGSTTAGGSSGTEGCGAATVPAACSTSGSPCSIDVDGTARTYYVYLPSNYSASQKYPLVFQFHPWGGSAEQAINMPNIRSNFPAIYVTPQGLLAGDSPGWANENGRDIAFTKAMLNKVQSSYCVDKERIFSTGFSYGGMMSFAVACQMSNVFRAIAPMSGALYSDPSCKGTGPAIAMWGSHGKSDNVVPIENGRSGRDKVLQQNHCGTETEATTPSPCVTYKGCDSGYPATWCEFDGGHTVPSFANSAIVTFFKQF